MITLYRYRLKATCRYHKSGEKSMLFSYPDYFTNPACQDQPCGHKGVQIIEVTLYIIIIDTWSGQSMLVQWWFPREWGPTKQYTSTCSFENETRIHTILAGVCTHTIITCMSVDTLILVRDLHYSSDNTLSLSHLHSAHTECVLSACPTLISQTNFDLFILCVGHARTAARHRNIATKICTFHIRTHDHQHPRHLIMLVHRNSPYTGCDG